MNESQRGKPPLDSKMLYRTYVAALTVRDTDERLERLKELLTPDFVAHDLVNIAPPGDIEALSDFRARVLTAFPDQTTEFLDIIIEGDRLASRQLVVGTHQGIFQGIPPTGRQISTELFEWVRVRDGRIAERWVSFDRSGMLDTLRNSPLRK